MATEYIWVGGAATVAQVDVSVYAGGTWTGDGTLLATLTDEAGNTQTKSLACTNVSSEAQRDAWLAILQAETQSLFQAITWTASGTDTILATASVPGVPFYLGITESVNDTTGTVTVTKDGTGASVLSEGPEDRNVDGSTNYSSSNWVTAQGAASVKPANGASNVKFNQGAWSMRYGLNDTSGYDEIRSTEKYTGDIGDPANGFYWIVDIDNAAAKALYVEATKGRTWITCTGENAYVTALPAGADALKFGAASDLTGVRCMGPRVRGTITCPSGMALDNITMTDCPAARLVGGAVTSLDRVDVGAGRCDLSMGTAAPGIAVRMQTWGSGVITLDSTVAVAAVSCALAEVYGGRIEWNGEGILTLLKAYGGTFTLENSTADVATISTTNQYGGIVEEGGMQNAIWTTFNRQGGSGNVSAAVTQWGTATD